MREGKRRGKRDRERERGREGGREREREGERGTWSSYNLITFIATGIILNHY